MLKIELRTKESELIVELKTHIHALASELYNYLQRSAKIRICSVLYLYTYKLIISVLMENLTYC